MTKQQRIGGYFVPVGENILKFESANALKSSVMTLFIILFGLLLFTELVGLAKGYKSLIYELTQGQERARYSIFFLPFVLPVIWVFLPATQVQLDRSLRIVKFKRGKLRYDFPWEKISYTIQWFPTKTGGAHLFTLVSASPSSQTLNLKLGSFDLKGPEHGAAIFGFLGTWMVSKEPASSLYQTIVLGPIGE